MPELPEVETVVRGLKSRVLGEELARVSVFDKKLSFSRRGLKGRLVEDVSRKGKSIVIELSGEKPVFLAFHLRMTGNLLWSPLRAKSKVKHHLGGAIFNASEPKYRRASFFLDSGRLDFVDVRRFGTISAYESYSDIPPYGIEPLSKNHTPKVLSKLLSGSTQPIKPWLLRQDRLVGLGNIYASEILFEAGIHPESPAGSLDSKQVSALCSSTKRILKMAVDHCGTTFSDFRNPDGQKGAFQDFLKVYNRENLPCRKCANPIQKIVQAGRSTYFCGACVGPPYGSLDIPLRLS